MAAFRVVSAVLFISSVVSAQQAKSEADAPPNSPPGIELPVTMRQKVVSGKTPVGTKVQARLTVATLISGKVVPEGAILTGEIVASTSKSAGDASRLAVRMDSAQWKSGAVPLKVYLTAWYYPVAMSLTSHDPLDRSSDTAHGSVGWGGGGRPPNSDSRSSAPFPNPGDDTDRNTGIPPAPPDSTAPKHRVLMHDVESIVDGKDGLITLTSQHADIKLDKSTIYVLAVSP